MPGQNMTTDSNSSSPEKTRWENEGQLFVFTYKEGLLSKVAHDLQIEATRFHIEMGPDQVNAQIDIAGLRVLGVIRKGQLYPNELRQKDKAEIERNMHHRVLQGRTYPHIHFVGNTTKAIDSISVDGRLSISNQEQPLSLTLQKEGSKWNGHLELVPSRWGIKPFRALMGAIRLQDRVGVTFSLPNQ